jgi:hypothetical protein
MSRISKGKGKINTLNMDQMMALKALLVLMVAEDPKVGYTLFYGGGGRARDFLTREELAVGVISVRIGFKVTANNISAENATAYLGEETRDFFKAELLRLYPKKPRPSKVVKTAPADTGVPSSVPADLANYLSMLDTRLRVLESTVAKLRAVVGGIDTDKSEKTENESTRQHHEKETSIEDISIISGDAAGN